MSLDVEITTLAREMSSKFDLENIVESFYAKTEDVNF